MRLPCLVCDRVFDLDPTGSLPEHAPCDFEEGA